MNSVSFSIESSSEMVSIAIEPLNTKDRDRMAIGLGKLVTENPSFTVSVDVESGQTIIRGISEFHIEIMLDRLKREHKCEVTQGKYQVVYYETIDEVVELDYQEIYRHQRGSADQYAGIKAKIRKKKASNRFDFISNVKSGSIPEEYILGVQKGLEESMKSGVLAGCQVFDIEVELYDGSIHDVDSSVLAFELCAKSWFKKVMHILQKEKKLYLMEPIMKVEVITPADYQSTITADLSSRRGCITDSHYAVRLRRLSNVSCRE